MYSIRNALIACLVILIASGAVSEEQKAETRPKNTKITPQEYEIYSVVLNEFGEGSKDRPVAQLVVQETTSADVPPGWQGLTPLYEWPGFKLNFPENLVTAWQKQNENDDSTISADYLKCKKKCVLMAQDKLLAFFKKDSGRWKDFYKQFPQAQGISLLSRVGFDEKGDRALVYEGTMRDNLGGWGYFMLLERHDGVWSIKDRQMVWIS
jgi:hypothetical protein